MVECVKFTVFSIIQKCLLYILIVLYPYITFSYMLSLLHPYHECCLIHLTKLERLLTEALESYQLKAIVELESLKFTGANP
mgnify:CR=1 FL=1